MKTKIHTMGITFYVGTELYLKIKEFADTKNISNSEFIRQAVESYFQILETEQIKQEAQLC